MANQPAEICHSDSSSGKGHRSATYSLNYSWLHFQLFGPFYDLQYTPRAVALDNYIQQRIGQSNILVQVLTCVELLIINCIGRN